MWEPELGGLKKAMAYTGRDKCLHIHKQIFKKIFMVGHLITKLWNKRRIIFKVGYKQMSTGVPALMDKLFFVLF